MSTPSLEMIPKGYATGVLPCVIPNTNATDFVVARASKRHRINSDLKLEIINNDIPAFNYDAIGGCPVLNTEPQATNLITYPISFGNPYWTKSGANIEGDPSTASGVDAASGYNFTIGFDSLNATIDSATQFTLTADNGWIRRNYFLEANKSYLVHIAGTTTGQALDLVDYLGSTLYYRIAGSGAFDETFLINTSTTGIFFGGTNLSGSVIQITTFNVQEVQGYSAPSVNFPTSAFKLVESAATSEHKIERRISAVSTDKHTLYVYAKANTRDRITIQNFDNSIQYAGATFDLLNGVIVGDITGSAEIKTMDNGWYKCSVTGTPPTTNLGYQEIALAESTHAGSIFLDNYLGDGTSGLYLFMAQLEESSVATSPTFTDTTLASEGSTTTRLQDLQYISAVNSTAWDFTSEDFSMVFDLTINDLSNNPAIYSKGQYSDSGWYIQFSSTGSMVVYSCQSGAAQSTNTNAGVFLIDTNYKIVITRSGADVNIYKDGVNVNYVSATHINPDSASAKLLNLGIYDTGVYPFNGNISNFQIYNTELTPTQVANL